MISHFTDEETVAHIGQAHKSPDLNAYPRVLALNHQNHYGKRRGVKTRNFLTFKLQAFRNGIKYLFFSYTLRILFGMPFYIAYATVPIKSIYLSMKKKE